MTHADDPERHVSKQPDRLSRSAFQTLVREFTVADRVRYTRHARQDHPERNITTAMIRNCLLKGTVVMDPFIDINGNWKAEVYRHGAGQALTVPVVILWDQYVLVITAY